MSTRGTGIDLRVNGVSRRLDVPPSGALVHVLRNDLGLVGTRFGCGQQLCGACHVLVDGRVAASCATPIEAVAGCEVTTIEHPDDPHLRALRRAFEHEQAAQCGACSPGMVITAAALLARLPLPTTAEVHAALEGNLCRCGAHARIVRAVQRAAEALGHG